MRRRRVACLLTTFAVVVATTAPAVADAVSFTDRRGDAPARYDLTRTSIRNGEERIAVVQKVRDLRGGRTQIYGFNIITGGGGYIVHTVRRRNGSVFTRFIAPDSETGCDIRARWRLGRNLIRVSMPRDCIVEDGTFRASTLIGAGDGTAGDPIDWTKRVRVGQD